MEGFYKSLFAPAGHRLLGRKLLPFSLWHLAQLEYAKSPLVGFPGEKTLNALRIASHICVTRYPHTLQPPHGYWAIAVHDRHCVRGAMDLRRPRAEWYKYLVDQGERPQALERSGSRFCECPPSAVLWGALKNAGFSEAEAWDMRVGRARWYKVILAEGNGAQLSLITDAVKQAMIKAGRGDALKRGGLVA